MTSSTRYLYDCSPNDFAYMPYIEALEYKIKQADILLSQLLKPSYVDRDYVRVGKVIKAISYNKQLIDELKEI